MIYSPHHGPVEVVYYFGDIYTHKTIFLSFDDSVCKYAGYERFDVWVIHSFLQVDEAESLDVVWVLHKYTIYSVHLFDSRDFASQCSAI